MWYAGDYPGVDAQLLGDIVARTVTQDGILPDERDGDNLEPELVLTRARPRV
jgi:hypothetical protein